MCAGVGLGYVCVCMYVYVCVCAGAIDIIIRTESSDPTSRMDHRPTVALLFCSSSPSSPLAPAARRPLPMVLLARMAAMEEGSISLAGKCSLLLTNGPTKAAAPRTETHRPQSSWGATYVGCECRC